MKEQFVTYEIALVLKELNFEEDCMACFTSKLNDNTFNQFWYSDQIWDNSDFHPSPRMCKNSDFGNEKSCTAPLWQQVIDWLLTEKKISVYVGATFISGYTNPFWNVVTPTDYYISEKVYSGFSNTLLEAKEKAILKAIELIKNK